jgi:protein-L-isoaspartate(D-aspartate) O-methyltransferase
MSLDLARARMIEEHLERRGITQRRLLDAFARTPRDAFVAEELRDMAYEDTPLPIGEEQTISQPYIVALTIEALELDGNECALEVGTGSGYAAAILSQMAREVFTIERHATLAEGARERLERLGYRNVHVLCGDGSLGWPEHAPYDAIAVAAGAPRIPRALLEQLSPKGRLVLPVSAGSTRQVLLRVRRDGDRFEEEKLTGVRFVPLIGEQGYTESGLIAQVSLPRGGDHAVRALIRECAEPLSEEALRIGGRSDTLTAPAAVDALVERIGDSRVVLLGEATHGTSEFYRARALITRALIEKKGFDFVAVEADWPDAARLNDVIVGGPRRTSLDFTPFTRFPTWMWRNRETLEFVDWLESHNARGRDRAPVGFHGLDLYSMFTSIAAVLAYLDSIDPGLARVARDRYGSLLPWQSNPAGYGQAVLIGDQSSSEEAVISLSRELLARRLDFSVKDGDRFFDAARNARLVANAERYYRALYRGAGDSWNLRDAHMFETLEALLDHYGPASRGVVWEHNSHVGDATATEMGKRGELNVGQLCRVRFDAQASIVGFGTDHGTVAAAASWGAPMRTMKIRPAYRDSYERLCHLAEVPAFVLQLRDPARPALRDELLAPRLERAIGVIYRPESELASHYYGASLPLQFDEYVWLDETHAVEATPVPQANGPYETFPFGV